MHRPVERDSRRTGDEDQAGTEEDSPLGEPDPVAPPVGVSPVGPGLLLVGPGYLSGCEGVEDGDVALDVVGRLD